MLLIRNYFLVLLLMVSSTVLILMGTEAQAWSEKALESSDPFVFTPNNLSTDFFSLDTARGWSWVTDSFEWVRVDHHLLVPRARVRIDVSAGSAIKYQGKTVVTQGSSTELLVVLTQEKNNMIEVNSEKIAIRFQAVRPLKPALIVDSSCSGLPIRLSELKLNHSWGFAYCHALHPKNGHGYTSHIDLQLVWETETPKTRASLNGVPVSSQDGVLYETFLLADSTIQQWKLGDDSFELKSTISPVFHPLSLSVGLGPYSNQDRWGPFATLYAAYYFNEQMKLVSFSALPLRSNPQIDTGLYVISEQFKGFDERVAVSLLLGAHALSFEAQGARQFKFSAPQGVEVNFRDAFGPNKNMMVGGFYYPMISDRSYINTWVRYGTGGLFWELNYIHWQEPVHQASVESRSFGLSLGFPLFKAL